uniref:F-box protein At3g16210 n=1 Tax=Cicer arietinum TaxID=3827 RepID=A0A1S3DVQ7_CICAR|nr:putative F-box protein At3g16210 [Cicer arietinum]
MASTDYKVSNHIHDDVVLSILSKLPLKSLKRFTCVCKSWIHLFENPYFITMFCNNLISRYHSFYDDTCLLLKHTFPGEDDCTMFLLSGERFDSKLKLDWPHPFQENSTNIEILGSGINGILCLYKVNHTPIVLWNPATEEFKAIPPNPVEDLCNFTTLVTLHGFGYDYIRDDYKVIRSVDFISTLTHSEHDTTMRPQPLWEIYSVRMNCWMKLNVDMPPRYVSNAGGDVYMNGACHWWGVTNNEMHLVSFDLSNEFFLTTPLPAYAYDSFEWVEKHLVVLNMSIAMISNYATTASFHISVLGEFGVKESWTKLFIIGPLPCLEHPIGVGKRGDIFFNKDDNELVCFDLSNGKIEKIGIKGRLFCCQMVIYKKSYSNWMNK